MRQEIGSVVQFWTNELSEAGVPPEMKIKFADTLREELTKRYTGHWYENEPLRGCGYRAISGPSSTKLDPVLQRVGIRVGLNLERMLAHSRDKIAHVNPGNVFVTYRGRRDVLFSSESERSSSESTKLQKRRTSNKSEQLNGPSRSSSGLTKSSRYTMVSNKYNHQQAAYSPVIRGRQSNNSPPLVPTPSPVAVSSMAYKPSAVYQPRATTQQPRKLPNKPPARLRRKPQRTPNKHSRPQKAGVNSLASYLPDAYGGNLTQSSGSGSDRSSTEGSRHSSDTEQDGKLSSTNWQKLIQFSQMEMGGRRQPSRRENVERIERVW